MKTFKIKSWLTGGIIYSVKAKCLWKAVESAVTNGVCLDMADFSNMDLSYARVCGAKLKQANFSNAQLLYTDFSRASLIGANFRAAMAFSANFYGSALSNADFYDANLGCADFCFGILHNANFSKANLSQAQFIKAVITNANFCEAHICETDFYKANVYEAIGINPYFCTPLLGLLDQPGDIIAYKLVTNSLGSPYYGKITYRIGSIVECPDADTDAMKPCAKGINVADLHWCIHAWRFGYRILRVKFKAKDIAAIPTGTDGKFRVRKCKVVDEVDLKAIGLIQKERSK